MLAIIGIILIFILGFLVVNLLFAGYYGEKIGLGFLVGSCLFTLLLFFLEKVGISFTAANSWLILLSSTSLSIFLNLLFKKQIIPKITPNKTKENLSSLIFLIFVSLSSFITNLVSPVKDWDALTLFDFRAKAFLFTHTTAILSTDPYLTMHNFYTTMMHYWFWLTGWFSPMPFYSLVFSSFLILSFFLFRRFLNTRLSYFFTIALALTPHFFENSFIAYTNLSYSIFMVLGAIYLYFWSKEQKWSDLILGLFFSVMTIWVRKIEPLWLGNLVVIPYFLIFKQNKKYLKLLVLAPILLVVFYAKNYLPVLLHFDFNIFFKVVDFIKWSVLSYYFPYFLLPLVIFIHQVFSKRLDWEILLLVISHFFLILIGAYGFASENPNYWSGIPDAMRRLTLYWPLLITFVVSLSLIGDKKADQ